MNVYHYDVLLLHLNSTEIIRVDEMHGVSSKASNKLICFRSMYLWSPLQLLRGFLILHNVTKIKSLSMIQTFPNNYNHLGIYRSKSCRIQLLQKLYHFPGLFGFDTLLKYCWISASVLPLVSGTKINIKSKPNTFRIPYNQNTPRGVISDLRSM